MNVIPARDDDDGAGGGSAEEYGGRKTEEKSFTGWKVCDTRGDLSGFLEPPAESNVAGYLLARSFFSTARIAGGRDSRRYIRRGNAPCSRDFERR